MTDLQVVAVITAKPGAEKEVAAAVQSLVEPTRAEEGCIAFDFYESAATPGTFVSVETWRAQSDLDAHLQSAHIEATVVATADLLASPPAIHPLTPLEA